MSVTENQREEQRKKKEYLGRYKFLRIDLDNKLEEKNSWKDTLLNISPKYSSQPSVKGVKDKIGDGVTAIRDIECNLDKDILELKKEKEKIEKIINEVPEYYLRNILTMRYINGFTWEEMIPKCNYSWPSLHRLHRKALDSIDLKKMI